MFELIDISKSFRGRPLLKKFSLKIERGEELLVVGETGSGKSTLARLLLRLVRPDSGLILFKETPLENYDPKKFRKEVQMLFQDASASLNPLKRIREMLPKDSEAFLDKLDLHPLLLDKRPGEISMGERQRFALVRALAQNPDFLVLDEPTASLDKKRRDLLMKAVREWKEGKDKTLLLISHDSELIRNFSGRSVNL